VRKHRIEHLVGRRRGDPVLLRDPPRLAAGGDGQPAGDGLRIGDGVVGGPEREPGRLVDGLGEGAV
jgi:hypothetical protein